MDIIDGLTEEKISLLSARSHLIKVEPVFEFSSLSVWRKMNCNDISAIVHIFHSKKDKTILDEFIQKADTVDV